MKDLLQLMLLKYLVDSIYEVLLANATSIQPEVISMERGSQYPTIFLKTAKDGRFRITVEHLGS